MRKTTALLAAALLLTTPLAAQTPVTLAGCEMVPFQTQVCATMTADVTGYTLTSTFIRNFGDTTLPFDGGILSLAHALFLRVGSLPSDPLDRVRLSVGTCGNPNQPWTGSCTVHSPYNLFLHGSPQGAELWYSVYTGEPDPATADRMLLMELSGEGVVPPTSTVPEPATWAMLAGGLALLLAMRHMRGSAPLTGRAG